MDEQERRGNHALNNFRQQSFGRTHRKKCQDVTVRCVRVARIFPNSRMFRTGTDYSGEESDGIESPTKFDIGSFGQHIQENGPANRITKKFGRFKK